MGQGRYVVILPVKSPGVGKSRLELVDRAGAAAAFAIDTVQACLSTSEVAKVVVTTDDDGFAARLADLGVITLGDPGRGLNAALEDAAACIAQQSPQLRPVALLADLPALRPADLSDALTQIETLGPVAVFVADAEGTGTVLYSAPFDSFSPRFGVASAQAHLDSGAVPVAGPLNSLRRDVDDLETLKAAQALGLGPATTAQLASLTAPAG